jgi:SAM-dependent methyltransferase
MNQFLRGTARAIAESFRLPEPILEIGSYQVEGQDDLVDLRGLFPGQAYTGVDFRPGPGVDRVASVEDLPQKTASVGTVIALSTFEHVQRFWRGFDEVERVLRPDGVFIVSTPFHFHVHAYPNDYWRFTPEALDFMMQRYAMRILGWHGAERRMSNVWAIGFREQSHLPTPADIERYRERMKAYAREPLPWHRRARYELARLVCGRRPLAPHLDRERWDIECRGHGAAKRAA